MFQKKKEEIEEPIPLTIDDIQKIKDKLSEKDKNEDIEIKIKDLKIKDLLPQSFGEVVITLIKNKHVIIFSDTINGDKYRTIRKSKGGIFSKDSLAYNRKKYHGKYLLIEGNGERKIVRLIEDEELLLFQTLKLIHGIIKDKPYMLLKRLEENENLISNREYIKKNSETEEIIEEVMNINPTSIDIEDDHEFIVSSVSLFDE